MTKNFLLEFIFLLAIQTNSKSGEDVSQITEPEWFVEKSAVKTDISEGKRPQIGPCRKISNFKKGPPFLTLVYPLQNKLITK